MDAKSIVKLAEDAGLAILEIYNRAEGFEITNKSDNSPLTEADIAAHNIIVEGLQSLNNIPIVSEEGNVGDPLSSNTCWLVDPLDGTKEFIKRNGMFTVNIALMKKNGKRWSPLFGVVHAPVTNTTWWGGVLHPSERKGSSGSGLMRVNPSTPPHPTRLVASGTHGGDKDESFAKTLGNYDLIRMGSSLKACIVAEGNADLYPRFGPTSCWDIAAAHAIVTGAGGCVLGPSGKTLDYDLVDNILNPFFMVAADDRWNEQWISHQD